MRGIALFWTPSRSAWTESYVLRLVLRTQPPSANTAPTIWDWKRGELNFSKARKPLELFFSAASSGSIPLPTAEIAP